MAGALNLINCEEIMEDKNLEEFVEYYEDIFERRKNEMPLDA